MRLFSLFLFFLIFLSFSKENNSLKLGNVKISNSHIKRSSNLNIISIYSSKKASYYNNNQQVNMVNKNDVPKEKVETKYVIALM